MSASARRSKLPSRGGPTRLFAQTFYESLLNGQTVGQSALAARNEVAKALDPSWLPYVVYAHPNTKAEIP